MSDYAKESRQKQIHQAQARALSIYKRKIKRRLILAAVCFTVIGIMIGILVAPAVKAQATTDTREAEYVSVRIENGDTLTSIADQYYENSGMSRKAFMREIMEMNHMDNTRIRSGAHIMVPCYEKM